MNYFLGTVSIILIFIFLIISNNSNKKIKHLLIFSFFLKVIILMIDEFSTFDFPDSNSDAEYFHRKAIEYSRSGISLVILDFFKVDNNIYPRTISIFYSIFGESKMMAQSIGIAFGTACIYLTYIISLDLWDERSAYKAAWVTALIPSLNIYSGLVLREIYYVFFFLILILGILNFTKKRAFKPIIYILVGYFFIFQLHGPSILSFILLIILLFFKDFKKNLLNFFQFKIHIYSFIFFLLGITLIIFYINNPVSIPYLGENKNIFEMDLLNRVNRGFVDSAKYPEFLKLNYYHEFFYKPILKVFYFLLGPFFWDVKSINLIFGYLDSLIYLFLAFCIFINFRAIWNNPVAKIFFLLFIFYILLYSISIGNFGTSYRHRSKFIVLMIILAAPKLIILVIKKFKKKYD